MGRHNKSKKELRQEIETYKWISESLQGQWDNLMHWMTVHPNDSLLDFMEYHVPSNITEKREALLEAE